MNPLLILIAESADGGYEPIAIASTRPEAMEMAVADGKFFWKGLSPGKKETHENDRPLALSGGE